MYWEVLGLYWAILVLNSSILGHIELYWDVLGGTGAVLGYTGAKLVYTGP